MWLYICGLNSCLFPDNMFTTPGGTSELEITSAKVKALKGAFSDAITTTVFPETIAGTIQEAIPSNGVSSLVINPTTPIGSSMVKLK